MTDDAERVPVRWGLVLLGVIVGGPAVYAIVVQITRLTTVWGGWPLSKLGLLALHLPLLGCFVVVSGLLVEHGLRGARRLPSLARTLGVVVLSLSGLCMLLLRDPLLADVGVLDEASQAVASVALALSAGVLFLLALVAWRCASGGTLPKHWRRVREVSTVVLSLTLAVLLVTTFTGPRLQHRPRPGRPVCIENARMLAIVLSVRSSKRGWPPYGGKNFVLALVAHKLFDIRKPENLEIFFCPAHLERVSVPGRTDYEAVTKDALKRRRFPTLTDFAGRRNDEPEFQLGDGDHREPKPILGCRYADGVTLGFSDGSVRFLRRDDLGLGPAEEIVFGDGSTSALLRTLSDH